MKFLNSATISVFSKPAEEDTAIVRQAVKELVPLKLEEEKILLKEETAQGFNEQPIKILSITLTKTSHTNAFLKRLLELLGTEQCDTLAQQKESRLDDELNFFIRIDKDKWLTDRQAVLTDAGNCLHIKMHIAAFPARRPDALALVDKIFKPE